MWVGRALKDASRGRLRPTRSEAQGKKPPRGSPPITPVSARGLVCPAPAPGDSTQLREPSLGAEAMPYFGSGAVPRAPLRFVSPLVPFQQNLRSPLRRARPRLRKREEHRGQLGRSDSPVLGPISEQRLMTLDLLPNFLFPFLRA